MLGSKISQKMTLHAKKSLETSKDIAFHYGSPEINSEHLLFAILMEEGSLGNNILKTIGIHKKSFKAVFSKKLEKKSKTKEKPKISSELKSIITRAYALASNLNYPYVGTEHLTYALVESDNTEIEKIIRASKEKEGDQRHLLESISGDGSLSNIPKIFDAPDITLSKNSTPNNEYLNQFCIDINEDVKKRSELIIGRDKELERIIDILGRKDKNNPVLTGDPGVGKTALVSGLAQKINSGEIPKNLLNKRILSLDMALVVAGTSFRGEFEGRIKEIIKEASRSDNIILFIDEIHNIVGAGNANGGLDAANILKPALSRGDIQCIGATTFEEYRKHIEKDPALERRFQNIRVAEPTPEETRKILRGIKGNYEEFHAVSILPDAIEKAVDLSVRYIQDRFLPDKAIDLIDETASSIKNRKKNFEFAKTIKSLELAREKSIEEKNRLIDESNYNEAIIFRQKEKKISNKIEELKGKIKESDSNENFSITGEDIAGTVSKSTGIPLEKIIIQNSKEKIKNLKRNLNSQIIGQKEAIERINDVITRSYSGIANPDRPLGSFLFLGPTGVGKTLTAKSLAKEIFGSEQSLLRIDMSEFMERHNVSRLTGAPAGYVGYEEGGKLTEKVRHQPYSLVLFDEVEKAHPDVFNILLQILEDGILTNAEGRQVDFKNTVVILTSNIGTQELTNSAKVGFGSEGKDHPNFEMLKNKVIDNLKKEVKPEILNRLDHIIVFNSLNKSGIKRIARLELKKFKKRLKDQGIELEYSPEVVDLLNEKSLALDQGARLVRKNVQEMVENEVARKIVEGDIEDKAKVRVSKGEITVI